MELACPICKGRMRYLESVDAYVCTRRTAFCGTAMTALQARLFIGRETEPMTPPADAPPTREQQPDEDDEEVI